MRLGCRCDLKPSVPGAKGRRSEEPHSLQEVVQTLSICKAKDLGLVALEANLAMLQRDTVQGAILVAFEAVL